MYGKPPSKGLQKINRLDPLKRSVVLQGWKELKQNLDGLCDVIESNNKNAVHIFVHICMTRNNSTES